MAGQSFGEDVVKPTTRLLPKNRRARFAPLIRRSEETPPLNTYRVGLVALPDWNSTELATSISYHRTSAPVPPNTVCWVHRATAPACEGSMAEMALVSRPSGVSMV